jgi:leader peptidase (prepilin peptidase)/N-methyltransferase
VSRADALYAIRRFIDSLMSLLQALQASPALFVTAVVTMSLAIGSFLNVVIHRMPKMLERQWREELAELNGKESTPAPRYNLMVPRSSCPSCGHQIRAIENIPLISYIALSGKCAACKAPIGMRYPFVEMLTGVLSGLVAWHYGFSWQTFAALIFVWAMIALAFVDLDTFFLPDDITLPLTWAGLLVNISATFVDLQSAVIGAAAGYLSLWAVFWAYKLATGKDGMGYGDFKLLAAIGAWLGWKLLPVVILLSSLVGAIVGVSLIVFARHGRNVPIPFGPYLVLGGVIALLWGEPLLNYYLRTL